MLPDVDYQDLAGRQGEQGTFAFKVLVFSSFSSIGAFDIHDQDVLCHAGATCLALVLAHPDALCGLAALLLGHDAELGAEEIVEQGRLAGRLRAEDGYEVVVESGGDDFLDVEIGVEVLATFQLHVSNQLVQAETLRLEGAYLLEDLVFVDDLDAMLVRLLGSILTDTCEVRVHHERRRGRMSNIARAALAIDFEEFVGHCFGAQACGGCTWCRKNNGVLGVGRVDVTGRAWLKAQLTSFVAAASLSRPLQLPWPDDRVKASFTARQQVD